MAYTFDISDNRRIVEALKTGDEETFKEVYTVFCAPLRHYATTILQNEQAAYEVVQDVFTAVWLNRKRLDAAKPLRNYLLRAVHNNSLRLLKYNEARRRREISAAAELRPDRPLLVTDPEHFPTDRYLAGSAARLHGREVRRVAPADLPELLAAHGEQVAVISYSPVDFRTGALHDMAALTRAAHEAGALALWDLSGSAGALDVDLHAWEADFALGCGYRYLGGGPGAPAYCFVADRHRTGSSDGGCDAAGVLHPLSGGFAEPASGLALSELRTGLSILDGVSPAALAAKTAGLVDLFLRRLRENCATACIEVVAPPDGRPHGAEVSLRHPLAQRVADELCNRGVLVEHAEPDVLRCSFAPSWLRYVDVWEATDQLHDVLHAVA